MDLYIIDVPEDSLVTAAGVMVEVCARFGNVLDRKSAFHILRALAPPFLVGSTDDSDALRAAQEALEGAGFTTATLEAGESPEALRMDEVAPAVSENLDAEPSDFVLAAQTALAFMAFADGAASGAVSFLATMGNIDPDGPYGDAIELLLHTFPPHAQQVAVAEAILEAARE